MTSRTPEGEIVALICEYLTARGVFFWRQNNTGKMPGGRYASVMKGVPDIIVVKAGKFIGLEVKTPDGRLSDDQHEFCRRLTLAGGDYHVARSVDDVIKLGL
jgi:hypothetical protein